MTRQLFFLITIISLSSSIVLSQTDQDNTNVGDIECNNLNPTDFENDLDNILSNVAWSDASSGACNGFLTYIGINAIQSSPPYSCNTADEIEVEVVLDCNGSSIIITVFLSPIDTFTPFVLGSGPPSPIFECDMALTDQDISDWINDVITNGTGVVDYFEDACSSVLTVTLDSGDPTPLNFTQCINGTYMVDFIIEDECGNSFDWTGQFDIEDNTPPDLDLSGAVASLIECDDLGSIQSEIEAILLGQNVIIDDCTDFSGLSIGDFSITPDPATVTTADLNPGGATCYEITFDINYEDPCGNFSNTAQLTIEVDDTVPPDFGGVNPMNDALLGTFCPREVVDIQSLIDNIPGGIDITNVFDACTDFSNLTIFDLSVLGEFYPIDCGKTGFVEWEMIDDCGNVHPDSPYMLEWTVGASPGNPTLEWLGNGPEDFFPPNDITISFGDSDCTDQLPNCLWENQNGNTWPWEALEDVHYVGGCDVEVFYSHIPCSMVGMNLNQNPPPELIEFATNSSTPTEVCITLTDVCDGTELEYCFEITVQCGSCGQVNSSFCETCEDSDLLFPSGCRLCDPVDLMRGFDSCNGFCPAPCPVDASGDQPPVLCNDGGNVPHNMSWFAFVANAESLTLDIEVENCTTGNGIQVGIYDSCDFDECIVWSGGCTTADQTLQTSNYILGQTYYLFIDGCNGDDCEFNVSIREVGFLGLPEIDAITAFSNTREERLTDNLNDPSNPVVTGDCGTASSITVCPGEEIQFGIVHKGDPGNGIPEHRDACGEYSEELDATFLWSTSWAGDIEHNPITNGGGFIPPLILPEIEGLYEICLEAIDFECDPQLGGICLQVVVESGLTINHYVDNDGDGFGAGPAILLMCGDNPGFSLNDDDCDDTDPLVFPGSIDYCCNGIDNDCDGIIDEDFPNFIFPHIASACTTSSINYTWDIDARADYAYTITVNGVPVQNVPGPNDSNFILDGLAVGDVVEFCVTASYPNNDPVFNNCVVKEIILDADGDGVSAEEDCDDNDPDVFPNNPEICDGKDNNCDGMIDEGFNPVAPLLTCGTITTNSITVDWQDIDNLQEYLIFADGIFFNSSTISEQLLINILPGTTTTVTVTAVFNNGCESLTSEIECTTRGIIDLDGDGVPSNEDCDDNDPNNFPGNTEVCDNRDNDCNGIIDEGFVREIPTPLCFDITGTSIRVDWQDIAEAESYNIFLDGNFAGSTTDTEFTLDNLIAATTYRIMVEIQYNNGCPMVNSEVICGTEGVIDDDGDGVPSDLDCDDSDPNNFPGNTEVCDEADNNCDGQVDEGVTMIFFVDSDRDGFGDDNSMVTACQQPPDTVSQGGDCDDTNPNINPAATEIPNNGIDEDCDGADQTTSTLNIAGHEVEIYPNPVTEYLTVSSTLSELNYTLIARDGSVVKQNVLKNGQIDMSGLSSGVYLLRIQDINNNGGVIRVVKM